MYMTNIIYVLNRKYLCWIFCSCCALCLVGMHLFRVFLSRWSGETDGTRATGVDGQRQCHHSNLAEQLSE